MDSKPLLMGNWKMHGDQAFARDLLGKLAIASVAQAVDLAVLVPHPYLFLAEDYLKGSAISWGAQNMHQEEQGAYTGEVSASMLCDFGCRYVLVGHSERRCGMGEDNVSVAAKYAAAVKAGLVPVLCVGETLADREAGKADSVVLAQLSAVFDAHPKWAASAIVAYEPVWAIGTGQSASCEQVAAMHHGIAKRLQKSAEGLAGEYKVLYGGSVKPDNAGALLALEHVNGALIGGAALQAESFLEIASLCTPSSC